MRLVIIQEHCYNGVLSDRIAMPFPNAYDKKKCKGCTFTFICRMVII